MFEYIVNLSTLCFSWMYSMMVWNVVMSSILYALVGVWALTLYLCLLLIVLVLLYNSELFISYAHWYWHVLMPYVTLLFLFDYLIYIVMVEMIQVRFCTLT